MQADQPGTTVLSAGIDWVTATNEPGRKGEILQRMATQWVRERVSQGFDAKNIAFLGYQGVQVDGVSYGSRSDGSIVRVSGESAASHGGSCLNYAANVSRLDLQVTTLDAPVGYDWTEYARGRARADARCITNQTKLLRIEGDPDGRTFYIGSRKSERFFRVYDKHAESKGTWPAGSWRWEVEYKGGRAAVVASYIRASGPGAESIRAIVAAAWLSYGVIMPGGTIPANWRDKSPKDQTDDAKRLEWLKTSIAPMVRRMLESHDPNVILGVLGLGAYRINEDGTNVREEY